MAPMVVRLCLLFHDIVLMCSTFARRLMFR